MTSDRSVLTGVLRRRRRRNCVKPIGRRAGAGNRGREGLGLLDAGLRAGLVRVSLCNYLAMSGP